MTDPLNDHPGDSSPRDDDPPGADVPPNGETGDAGLDAFGGEIPLDPDEIDVWLASARSDELSSSPGDSSDVDSFGDGSSSAADDHHPSDEPGTGPDVSSGEAPEDAGTHDDAVDAASAAWTDDAADADAGVPDTDGDVVASGADGDRDRFTFGVLTDEGTAEPMSGDDTAAPDVSQDDLGLAAGHPGGRGDGWGLADSPPPTRLARWPVVGRMVRWAVRPWSNERIVMFAVTAITLTVTTFVMMKVTHMWQWPILGNPLQPWEWEWRGVGGLVFRDNTPTGGDMGAHVWASAYLRDELLPNWQLSGWSMDWYAGLPVYRFYMVLPALAIVALNSIFTYGVAFKLVAVAGLVLFPVACWTFGRMARFRYPLPELFAIAAVCFTLDESYSIYGGNLKSTMAGEFSFSIALTLAFFGLALLARGLETGKYRVRTAIVLAAACISHGIVLIFVMVAATVFALVWLLVTLDVKRLYHALVIGVLTLMLSAFWVLPFVSNRAYMTDMKYEPKPAEGFDETFWTLFFPLETPLDFIITASAIIGVVSVVMRRQINGVALAVTGLVFVGGVYLYSNGTLPFDIGLLWNPRLLPFVYLVRYLLMMVGIMELVTTVGNIARNRPGALVASVPTRTVTWGVVAVAVYLVLGFMFRVLPFGDTTADGRYQVGPIRSSADAGRALGDGWARYNFLGYEGRNRWEVDENGNEYLAESDYTEYYNLVQTMAQLGETDGCGRAYWENSEDNGEYGTTMALMLLPYWTDGCIASMEGLYFEASATTPYHFLASTAMSEEQSTPVRELDYSHMDPDAGVPELQALGVRYVMLRTDAAKEQVADRDELTPVAESGTWTIYELSDSEIVTPLDTQPVVVNDRAGEQRERNLELGTSWFQNQGDWAAMPANDGPDDWQRIDVEVDEDAREYNLSDNNETLLWPELVARVEDRRLTAPDGAGPTALVARLNRLDPGDSTTLVRSGGSDGEENTSVTVEQAELVEDVVPTERIAPTELEPVSVSNVQIEQQSLSFDVDQVGVPVLVKVSYFPNWTASGADGPYRIGSNMMVVVPTDNEVEMSFERSTGDNVAYGITVIGILAAIGLGVRRRRGSVAPFPPDNWYDDGTWEWGNDENSLVSRYRELPRPMRSLPPGPPSSEPPSADGHPPPTPPESPEGPDESREERPEE